MSKDLLVRLLTIIFTPIAAAVSAYAAKHGLNLPPATVVTVGALAGAGVLGIGFHWLQKQPVVQHVEVDLESLAEKLHAKIAADPALNVAAQDLEGKLAAQTDQIIGAIGSAVHAPVSVQDVVKELANAVVREQPPEPSPPPLQAV